jgi:hypothetical protein
MTTRWLTEEGEEEEEEEEEESPAADMFLRF